MTLTTTIRINISKTCSHQSMQLVVEIDSDCVPELPWTDLDGVCGGCGAPLSTTYQLESVLV